MIDSKKQQLFAQMINLRANSIHFIKWWFGIGFSLDSAIESCLLHCYSNVAILLASRLYARKPLVTFSLSLHVRLPAACWHYVHCRHWRAGQPRQYSWRHLAAAMANKAAQAMHGWPEAYVPVPALARPVTVRKNLLWKFPISMKIS